MTIKDLKANNLILLECITGSKAYGLDTPGSDTDIKGVFYLPRERFFGLNYVPQVNNETNDEVYYELGRFVELLIKNNPNLLELLASPEKYILYKDPIMERISLKLFLSKLCRDTFAGYASTQIRKARGYKKKIVNPIDAEKKSILDFCFIIEGHVSIPARKWLRESGVDQETCGLTSVPHAKGLYALYISQDSQYSGIVKGPDSYEVALSSVDSGENMRAFLFFNQDGFSTYCKDYREYWDWVEKRNEDRFHTNMSHGKDYDAKNMMHTIRLLQSALKILESSTLDIVCSNRDELLSIKAGDVDYQQLVDLSDHLLARIDSAAESSSLPDEPDKVHCEEILVKMRNELYLKMEAPDQRPAE
ncbi:MAG: nucleotidyltransferase domain-containing protein [Chitinophagaceae bacterium]